MFTIATTMLLIAPRIRPWGGFEPPLDGEAKGRPLRELGACVRGRRWRPHQPPNLRQRSFTPLLKKVGLPHITFHNLRHACALLLLQRNAQPKLVQELLGHASVVNTLDTHSHMVPGMGGEAAAMGEALD